ncbi:MAG: hypothetical protein H6704_17675 [Myxococcales bacterium]|nr:hypothetical protein [Myxococcales bacterium]
MAEGLPRRSQALIEADFDGEPRSIYRARDLETILRARYDAWGLSRFDDVGKLIATMERRGWLQPVSLQFPRRRLNFLVWRQANAFELPAAVSPHAFLSHYTALVLHDLTDDQPKTIYLAEPRPSRRATKEDLGQEVIDAAMEASPVLSKNRAEFGGYEIVWLETEVPERVQVSQAVEVGGRSLRVSTIEKTLLDAVVRPEYCGGVHQLPAAFRRATEALSINRLVKLLRGLQPRFPYHQALGFLLERAGYDAKLLKALRALDDGEHSFFVGRGSKATMAFDASWRVHYPPELPL